jgi:hypothetical protein
LETFVLAISFFLGDSISVIPLEIFQNDQIWSNVSPKGYMDEIRFQHRMLNFIDFIKKNKKEEEDEFILSIIDGHNSRLNPDTIYTVAQNRIIIFIGPSNLTHCWQAHDAGVNKKFKDLIQKQLESFIELKQPIGMIEVAQWCQNAIYAI